MAQATQTASRTSYQRRATTFRSAHRAEMPLYQAFSRHPHQEATDCHCIKDGRKIEGVDIPEINMELFLRPTESATVFIQQLGRGLRLSEGKDCLTVLDFVGQADRHYNYAMKFRALTGQHRKSLRRQIENGFTNLPRGCYIQLDKKARDYILANINQLGNTPNKRLSQIRTFEEDFGVPLNLENFLTAYGLSLYDFYRYDGKVSMYSD